MGVGASPNPIKFLYRGHFMKTEIAIFNRGIQIQTHSISTEVRQRRYRIIINKQSFRFRFILAIHLQLTSTIGVPMVASFLIITNMIYCIIITKNMQLISVSLSRLALVTEALPTSPRNQRNSPRMSSNIFLKDS